MPQRSLSYWHKKLAPFLTPFGNIYALCMVLRRMAFERGLFKRFCPAKPCVAVGNISWGGSGKTPLVSWLLQWAEHQDLKATVLTRGYKARPPHLPYEVTRQSPWQEAGDEPLMLKHAHEKVRVVVDPKRIRSGPFVEQKHAPDLIILDDGFQHLSAARDMDLVLLRLDDLTDQWNRVIPAGTWREKSSALTRASAFCIKASKGDVRQHEARIRQRLERFGKPVFTFDLVPTGLRTVGGGKTKNFAGEPYVLVSAVGNPQHVEFTTTKFLGASPSTHYVFSDHHAYTRDDWNNIVQSDSIIICTPKDAVKLRHLADERLWTFDLNLAFGSTYFCDQTFTQWWTNRWEELRKKSQFIR